MKDATPLGPLRMSGTLYSNVNNIQYMSPDDQKT